MHLNACPNRRKREMGQFVASSHKWTCIACCSRLTNLRFAHTQHNLVFCSRAGVPLSASVPLSAAPLHRLRPPPGVSFARLTLHSVKGWRSGHPARPCARPLIPVKDQRRLPAGGRRAAAKDPVLQHRRRRTTCTTSCSSAARRSTGGYAEDISSTLQEVVGQPQKSMLMTEYGYRQKETR